MIIDTNDSSLSILELVDLLEKRYLMYFSERRLDYLANYIAGYSWNTDKESLPPFYYFNHWTKYRLDKWGASMNWERAILSANDNDQSKALDAFFVLIKEFQTLKPTRILIADLSADHFSSYYAAENKNKGYRIIGNDNRWVLDPAPYHIKLVEFDYCTHAYHFDYYYAIKESDKGVYSRNYESLKSSKEYYESRFGAIHWEEIQTEEMPLEFQAIVANCANGRTF